jgi:hypothetical protein
MAIKRSIIQKRKSQFTENHQVSEQDERARQFTDITNENDDDAAECAAADLFREFPPTP